MFNISLYYLADLLGTFVIHMQNLWSVLTTHSFDVISSYINELVSQGYYESAALLELLLWPFLVFAPEITILEVLLGGFSTMFIIICLARFFIGIFK